MVKHIQTIRRQKRVLSGFDHFVGLTLKGITLKRVDYVDMMNMSYAKINHLMSASSKRSYVL